MVAATTLPADAMIVDLVVAGPLTGTELFEAVQTTGGVGLSVQATLANIQTFLAQNPSGVLPVANGGQGTSTLTANAVLLGNGNATLGFAVIGTGGQVLIDQGAGLNPAFTVIGGDISVSAGGTATIAANAVTLDKLTQGTGLSVLANVTTATASFTAVIGAADQLLTINHAATTVLFRSISSLIDTAVNSTQGSILYRNAATWTNLPATTAGYQLQTQGSAANPQWVGSMTLLNRLTPNGVASTNDTSSLTAAYRSYMIAFENVCPATNTTTLQMTLATTGSAFATTGYVSMARVTVSAILVTDTSTSVILLTGSRATAQITTTTIGGLNGVMFLENPAGNTLITQFNGNLSYLTPGAIATTTFANVGVSGMVNSSAAITGVNFAFSAGNIATGTIAIYGLS